MKRQTWSLFAQWGRGEREEQEEGVARKDERRGDGRGRVREHRGSESEEGGSGEEGWGEKERGSKLFIPVGDNNDLILWLFYLCLAVWLMAGRATNCWTSQGKGHIAVCISHIHIHTHPPWLFVICLTTTVGLGHFGRKVSLVGSHARLCALRSWCGHTETWSGMAWRVCVCVSGGRRSAERWGMARGYLAMCCETVLTQDTASSYNNRAVTLPGTRCKRDSVSQYLQVDTSHVYLLTL